jgi:hypothetical protein
MRFLPTLNDRRKKCTQNCDRKTEEKKLLGKGRTCGIITVKLILKMLEGEDGFE